MATPPITPEPAFAIDVRFRGGLTGAQQDAFAVAAARWSRIISADLPAVVVDGERIDDVVIDADGTPIDGPRGILGRAGPTQLRPTTFLPAAGVMSFDRADLARMEADGSLVSVIVHEMGHVLGFGTIFARLGLIRGAGGPNPAFVGPSAMREYAGLRGDVPEEPVPLANVGGPGTRDGHWRESTFANELMTGSLNAGPNPLSRMTIAAFDDLGYAVDYNRADPYRLPGVFGLEELQIEAPRDRGHECVILIPEQTVLPESALV